MRRDRQRLHDIIEALAWVTAAARGRTEDEDQFSGDETLRYAIARQLAVVGEAAARYFGVHWPLVWQTVTDDVPLLLEGVTEILRLEFPEQ
jgi:uncharacterized protein with HEPN domain